MSLQNINIFRYDKKCGKGLMRWWNCIKPAINKCKITNWKEGSKNRADWEKSIKEVKVCIGL